MNNSKGFLRGRVFLCRWLAAGLAGGTALARAERFERPGVVADRVERVVRVEAFATGLDKSVQTEFILIGPKSGHDYEAAAVSRALPSDVHAALEYIGLRPGAPANPAKLRFWARGPRVDVFVEWEETAPEGVAVRRRARAEEAIVDRRTRQTLPPLGFVFTGSVLARDEEDQEVYAADHYDPMAILPAYNESAAVFDIPRRGSKEELYDFQYMNGALGWREKQPLVFEFRPARPEGPPFEQDGDIRFFRADDGSTVFTVGLPEQPSERLTTADALGEWRRAHLAAETLYYAKIHFDAQLSLRQLAEAAAWIDRWIEQDLVRVEPPAEGELYFKAFAPNPAFRDRARRPVQPLELHLRRTEDGVLTGELVRVTRKSDPSAPAAFDATARPIPSPPALRQALDEESGGLAVLLVFAPADTTYGALREFLRPALSTHPILYCFAE